MTDHPSGGSAAERGLAAQYAAARILADAGTLEQAAPRLLAAIGQALGWDAGALWRVDEAAAVLRCVHFWHRPDAPLDEFKAYSESYTFVADEGLPGRVWSRGRPSWVTAVAADARFPRSAIAARTGVKSGLCFPLLLGAEVLGVIEFWDRTVRARDPDMLDMMAALGSQIGQFVERRSAEAAQRESEARNSAILEAALDGIVTMDHHGRILEFNPAAERIFGHPRERVIGRRLADVVIPPALREQHRTGLARYLAGGPGSMLGRRLETTGLRADGSEFPVELAVVPIRRDGPPIFTGYIRDITARKRDEAERTRLLAEAREANRLRDEFLGTLSHELRTPVAAILSWAHLLRGGRLTPPKAARALETIERNARTQARLIDDVLDVSRIIAGKLRLELRPTALGAAVAAAVETVRPAAEAKRIALVTALDDGGAHVRGDADRLQQVAWNLLANAIKFTPEGGQVEVRLARRGGQAELTVRDTGVGIRAEFLPYVFDRFRQGDSTTTRAHGGLGLGLAIARHLVELHGGAIEADSPGEGRGTTLTVRLPVRAGEAPGATAAGGDAGPSLARLRVLVVDDDAEGREVLASALGHYGAAVTVAASAAEALAAIERAVPDVLVSDIAMPGEDGYMLIRRVRALPAERGGGVPALALTAYGRPEDRHRALEAGYQSHLLKTVSPDELVAEVARLARSADAA